MGHFLRNHLGNPVLYTNAKIKRDLGLTFMDPVESIRDTIDDFIKWGHLPAAQK
jgi:dihydroflavonol-4-reductase